MPTTTTLSTIEVDRRRLLTALQRIGWVVPKHTAKPILQGVRLSANDGCLRLSATNLDNSLSTTVAADGELPSCVVPFADFASRIKAAKSETCSIELDCKGGVLAINGGRVEHRLQVMETEDFPPLPSRPEGTEWRVSGQEFRAALGVALRSVAKEPSRYAINGVLLDVDKKDARLVATDGRRMVVVELDRHEGPFKGRAILPLALATLVGKLVDGKNDDVIAVHVKAKADDNGEKLPSDLYLAGPDWLVSSEELEGSFPQYGDVVPQNHSKFVVDRADFIDTLSEVSLATNEERKAVRLDLTAESLRVSAGGAEVGESSGTVTAEFIGGGDSRIITAFNPGFVLDALKSLPDDRVVIDVEQNHLRTVDNKVLGRPAIVSGVDSQRIRWVLMPVSLDVPPSRETLGSNFKEDQDGESAEQATALPEGQNADSEAVAPTDSVAQASPAEAAPANRPSTPRRRYKVERVWPEIGMRLDAEYMGETYAVLVIAAPKLKSGRALQLINGPALGQIFNSMTSAMKAATAAQRRKAGLGTGVKGLPTTGWDFWKPVEKLRASA